MIISPLLHVIAPRHGNDRSVTHTCFIRLNCTCFATCFCTSWTCCWSAERLISAPLPRRLSFTVFGKTAWPPCMHSLGNIYPCSVPAYPSLVAQRSGGGSTLDRSPACRRPHTQMDKLTPMVNLVSSVVQQNLTW